MPTTISTSGSDGRIYVLTHEIRSTTIRYWRHLKPPRIDDFVVVLSPDGEELQKVSVVDAFIASPFARMVNQVAWYTEGDYFHTNAIDVLEPAAAAALMPGARQPVLLSMRELGALAILDLADGRFGWAAARILGRPARSRPPAQRQPPAVRQLRPLSARGASRA